MKNHFIKKQIVKNISVSEINWGSLSGAKSNNSREYRFFDYKNENDGNYIENKPMSGFVIDVNRMIVKDIRGFSYRLTRNNIIFLIKHSIIKEGHILESCQYVRLARNSFMLVPVRMLDNG